MANLACTSGLLWRKCMYIRTCIYTLLAKYCWFFLYPKCVNWDARSGLYDRMLAVPTLNSPSSYALDIFGMWKTTHSLHEIRCMYMHIEYCRYVTNLCTLHTYFAHYIHTMHIMHITHILCFEHIPSALCMFPLCVACISLACIHMYTHFTCICLHFTWIHFLFHTLWHYACTYLASHKYCTYIAVVICLS